MPGNLLASLASSAATTFTAATETTALVLYSQGNTTNAQGEGIEIDGVLTFTAGATAGTVTLTVRQLVTGSTYPPAGNITGTVVKTLVLGTSVVSVNNSYAFKIIDNAPVSSVGNTGAPAYAINVTVAGSNGTGVYVAASMAQIGVSN